MAITEETIRKDLVNRNFRNLGIQEEVYIDIAIDQNSNSASYVDASGSLVSINFDDYLGYKMYLELVGYVNSGTGYFKLVNTTDSADLTNSETSTASTSAVRVRSSEITKPLSGTKNLKLQYKNTGGGTTYIVKARIVFVL